MGVQINKHPSGRGLMCIWCFRFTHPHCVLVISRIVPRGQRTIRGIRAANQISCATLACPFQLDIVGKRLQIILTYDTNLNHRNIHLYTPPRATHKFPPFSASVKRYGLKKEKKNQNAFHRRGKFRMKGQSAPGAGPSTNISSTHTAVLCLYCAALGW